MWDTYLAKDKYVMERIQNRAVRWVCGVRPTERVSITKLRNDLQWPTLETRRQDIRLTYLYKVINREVVVTLDQLGLRTVTQELDPNINTSSENSRHGLTI